jgi:hypothetical protein
MIYLSGTWSVHIWEQLKGYPVGLITTPDIGSYCLDMGERVPWAADNGCFAQGEKFNLSRYLAWLQAIPPKHRQRCLFATAPDVVGDWTATWKRSQDVLPALRDLGYAAAVVLQDGAESDSAIDWQAFDAVFVGGSTGWKLSHHAERLCLQAKRERKWVHMGRVNSLRRIRAATEMGCDSADGTFLKIAPDANIPRMKVWLDSLHRQPSLLGRMNIGE